MGFVILSRSLDEWEIIEYANRKIVVWYESLGKVKICYWVNCMFIGPLELLVLLLLCWALATFRRRRKNEGGLSLAEPSAIQDYLYYLD